MSHIRLAVVSLIVCALSVSFAALLAASAAALLPASAPHGARAIIVGSGLDAGSTVVSFAAAGGGTAPAAIISQSADVLEIVVPSAAASGPVTVTSGGATLAILGFTLLPDPALVTVTTLGASVQAHDLFKDASGVAVASSGKIYVTDTLHHQVKILAPDGQLLSTIGTGDPGFVNGPAGAAKFKQPAEVVVDVTGSNIYVADTGNNVIREIAPDGTVTTFAGSGAAGDSDGPASQAAFKQPIGLAFDLSGNLLVADSGNHRIRLITPAGTVTTLAGGVHDGFADGAAAQALFKQPSGIIVSPSGVVFVADTGNNRIRKIDAGQVSTVAGTGQPGLNDGSPLTAQFNQPSAIASDDAGNLFIADTLNHAIRKVAFTPSGTTVSTVSGNGSPGYVDGATSVARFKQPAGIDLKGALFVGDAGNDALRVIYSSVTLSALYPRFGPLIGGTVVRLFGTGFVAGATAVTFGDVPAIDVTFVGPTEILATAPPHVAGAVDVVATTPAGAATLASAFTYVPPPTLTFIDPHKGKTAGGETVTLIGTNFVAGETIVSIGGAPAQAISVISPASISAATPAGSAGPADVTVSTPGGSATLTSGFTYFAQPAITNFSPLSGRSGTVVTIAGTNFDPAVADDVVRIGSAIAAVTSASATQLVITIPSGAASGVISVVTAGGTAVSTSSFQVITYVALTISPDPAALDIGTTLQLSARGIAPDGSTSDVTSQATWTSANTNIATVTAAGIVRGIAAGSTTITATLGPLTQSVNATVQIPEPLPPDPKTVATPINQHSIAPFTDGVKFLFTGPNPIQTGVTSGAISDDRIAVIRGKVTKRDGTPLPGVQVRIVSHGELGQTLSRADGIFDLAVNGGGVLTVAYQKNGFLPVQRTIDVPWQDFIWAPDVILIPLDATVTAVDLASPRLQVARGSIVADGDGTRQATLLVPAGTAASLKMPDGSTQPLTTLNVRATEYTVGPSGPNAMPGTLPPAVTYTWCVDLHADEASAAGASSVLFSKPLTLYIENFLQIPIGAHVPVGSYDQQQGRWMPELDGRVIRIVSITSGLADIDTNGDGSADDAATLAQLGIDDTERQQIATLYTAGQSVWRTRVTHFTPFDLNFGVSLPNGAEKPTIDVSGDQHLNDCCRGHGSVIEMENQTVGEIVPVIGSPFSLAYNSGRVLGRAASRSLAFTAKVPSSANGVGYVISVAGNLFTLPTASTTQQQFDWDGRDAYGRPVAGSSDVRIVANAYYPNVFGTAGTQPLTSWGRLSISFFAGSPARGSVQLVLSSQTSIRLGDAHTAGDSGWMLDAEEHYDPATRILYEGNGSERTANDLADTILRRVAGNGGCCYNGEGMSALDAKLNFPFGVKIGPDGSIYLADSRRVRVVSPDGTINTVAGNGTCCYSGDGGPATSAQTNIADVAVANDGTLYIADFSNRVRMVRNGIITTIAGTGVCCSSGDDGPALSAKVDPQGITVGDDGTVYIAERSSFGIRRITPDGIISSYTFANDPRGLSTGPDGSLYFTDFTAGKVYRIRREGNVELVAGAANCSGNHFIIGDGGNATSACLAGPWYATADRQGVVYIAERNGDRIRAVTPDGTIRTVAGNGQSRGATLKDVLAATSSVIDGAFGIAAHPNGMVYFTDFDLDVLWRIEPKLAGRSLAGEILIPAEDGSTVSVFHGSQHVRTVDALTGVTLLSFAHDSENRLTSATDLDGNVTTLERDANGNLTGVVAPNGQRTGITTEDGLITKITDPASGEYRFDYYDGALLKSMTTPRAMTTSFQYDPTGRLSRDTDAAGGFQALTRTGTNKHYIANRSTAEGRTTTYDVEYAADGAVKRTITQPTGEITHDNKTSGGLRTMTSPDGSTATPLFGPDSRFGMGAPVLSSATVTTGSHALTASSTRQATLADPNNIFSLTSLVATSTVNGKVWQSTWNAAARSVVDRSPAGRIVTSTLDTKGRVASVQVPGLSPLSATYDALGRLQSVQQGTRTTALTYDSRRYVASVTDSLHRTVSFDRDDLGRVTTETLTDGRTVLFGYDADGNMTSITPPGRPLHGFSFTPVDLVGGYTPPAVSGTGATTYRYNRDRQLTLVTRPDGQNITLGYDTAGRVQSLIAPALVNTFGYDGVGRVASISSSSGESLAYSYDGSLLTAQQWSGEVSGTVAYTYNSDLRLASENGIGYGYDGDGLLTSAGALTLTNDAQTGLLTGTSIGLLSDAYSYNVFGEPAGYSFTENGGVVFDEQYVRDDAGRIASRTETFSGTSTTFGYGYDAAGRLASVTRDGTQTAAYTYNTNSGRATKISAAGTEEATYDDQDRLLTYNGMSYTYTANGELSSKTDASGTTSYVYDALDNLRTVVLPDTTRIDYVIDGQNRRVGKKVNGTLVQGWLYADQLRVIAELDGSGALVAQFVYGTHTNVPDYIIRSGNTYRIVTDHTGSPRFIVDIGGNLEQQMDYDEFGYLTADTNPGFQPFGFAGGFYDRDTGLVRFGARDYDPQTGHWTTKDPLMLGGGDANLYAYDANDPINNIDPTGLWCFNADKFGKQIEENRFDLGATAGTLATTLGIGTMPKVASELRGLGLATEDLNPITSQLSRWAGRLGFRALREFGRTTAGVALSTAATAALVFEGFYDWGVIGKAAWDATSSGCGCK